MISLNNIDLYFGSRPILKDVSFQINKRDRIGLVGNNGAGKTTLLRLILGKQRPDRGSIEKPPDLTTGYLPQQMKHSDKRTLFNEVKTAFDKILQQQKKMRDIDDEINSRNDYGSPEYIKLISKSSQINSHLDMLGIAKIDERIEKTLAGLGFRPEDFSRPTSEFSGGWRMRIELAKILLKYPDIILLDEPTNHLDIESIQWLEEFLADYSGSVIVISHDRTFLDRVTTRTIEISLAKIYDYKAPYSKYRVQREELKAQQLAAYKNQQREIAATERFIERFRYKNTKASQVQSRIKMLEKMEKIEIEEEDISSIRIRFPAAPRSGEVIFDAAGISKSYGSNLVLDDMSLMISKGQRIAFVGRNGEGKTTLSRILVGDLDFDGNLKTGHNVKMGYFAQNQDELLEEDLTVLDTIGRAASGEAGLRIRSILGAFLFREDDIDKKVKVLSGGERSRLALIKLLLQPYNVLILDEPTNHLDMRSKDILKKALDEFSGTLILVSHDREFLSGLVDNVYEFKDHKIIRYLGGIDYFLEKKRMDSLRQLEKKDSKPDKVKTNNVEASGNQSYREKKQFQKKLRKAAKDISICESEIEHLENRIKEITDKFHAPEKLEDSQESKDLYIKYEDLKKSLDKKLLHWEDLHEVLSGLKQSKHYQPS